MFWECVNTSRPLDATLEVPEGARFSELERLRRPPMRTTGTAFARSLERVDEIGAFGLGRVRLSQVPPNRLAALARYGLGSKAASLERAEEPKRTAMLTAVMRHLEAKVIVPMPGRDTRIARYTLLVFDRVPSLHRPNREGSSCPGWQESKRVSAA
ncbi:hypothetical protein MPY17_00860 [Rhodococcus opacus]|uniref:hypothetical protein n=1 Tax=Rhodococcus opacus TaxID=37919 RepID=UPI001FF0E858|nr:hypothetical protein [Rhodococcus opacus]UOT04363.1 hypothetical protein MPY17_00860 [Rhodococcus opacus]